jgi:phosphoserine aminotransferase
MQQKYFTAGPSQLHPQYQQFHQHAMDANMGSMNHRSDAFRKVYQETDAQLRILLNLPPTHCIYFAGSATEIWERMILNLVKENSFHFVNGSFSERFYEYSKMLGKNATAITAEHGAGFDFDNINIPQNTELICTTQNETSSGVSVHPDELKKLKLKYPNALLCTDLVSIAPISSLDYNYIDSSFFSVQKAFGMPPGLGVWIVNDACLAKNKAMQNENAQMGAHHTLEAFQKNYEKWETPSTPNIIAIYIIGQIAKAFNEQGIENIRTEISAKAKLVYEFASTSKNFTILVKDENFQSESVIVLQCKNGSEQIIKDLKAQGLHVTSGYGKFKNDEIRIANFPSTTKQDMLQLIESLEVLDRKI